MKITDNRKHSTEFAVHYLKGGEAFIYNGRAHIFAEQEASGTPLGRVMAIRVNDGKICTLPDDAIVTPIEAEFIIKD